MIVLIYECGIQLLMRYQMFFICLFLRIWNPNYIILHILICKFLLTVATLASPLNNLANFRF